MDLIASWNVNSIAARLDHVIKWVQTHRPQALMLQELKCVTEAFPSEPFENMGYNLAIHGQKTYNGVAILTKSPIEEKITTFPGQESDPQARYLEIFSGGRRLVSVYVPNGQEVGTDKYAYKLDFYKNLTAHGATLLSYEEDLVMGGDFNVAPHLSDAYDSSLFEKDRILCSMAEREAFQTLMHKGFIDIIHATNPPHTYTWWDYRAGSYPANKGMRIDHFLIAPQTADQVIKAYVDTEPRGWQRPSDHTPICLELRPHKDMSL